MLTRLVDGATVAARGDEATEARHFFFNFARRQRLNGFEIASIGASIFSHGADKANFDAVKRLVVFFDELFSNLSAALVTAGLKQGGSQSDGPNVCFE